MVYNDVGEEIRRLFVPSAEPSHYRIPLSELVVYNESKQISQLRWKPYTQPHPIRDDATMVVHIDGACRNSGTPAAQASYGGLPQTSTRAEIEALSAALDIICDITNRDFKLQNIKIATDSSFLVDAMSKWMEDWIVDNGIGSNGRPIAHFESLKQLHDKLDYMEFSDEGGREVQFWLVPREMNGEADKLANRALDGV